MVAGLTWNRLLVSVDNSAGMDKIEWQRNWHNYNSAGLAAYLTGR
jgi:hypothetical protein